METRIEKQDAFKRLLEVKYSPEDINVKFDVKLKEVMPKLNVPGFRPGKVPVSLVKVKFGDYLLQDVQQEILSDDLENILKEKELVPLYIDKVDFEDIKLGEDFIVTSEFYVKPEIEGVLYKGLKFEKPVHIPAESAVDEAIKSMLEQNAHLEEVDRVSQKDDYVVVKYEDDIKYLPLTSDIEEKTLELLIGIKKDDEVEGVFTFPESYIDKTLAGKTIETTFKVMLIKNRELPELNKEFFITIFPEVETEELFREKIRENMKIDLESRSKQQLEDNAVAAIVEANELEIPEEILKNESVKNFAMKYRIKPEQVPDEQREEIFKNFGDYTSKALAGRWYLERIGDIEEIEVSDQDIDKFLEPQAQRFGIELEELNK